MTIVTEPLTWKINILPRSTVDVRHFTLRTNICDSQIRTTACVRTRYFSSLKAFSCGRHCLVSFARPSPFTIYHLGLCRSFQSKQNKTPNAFEYFHNIGRSLLHATKHLSRLRQWHECAWCVSLCNAIRYIRLPFVAHSVRSFIRFSSQTKFSRCVWKSQNFSLVLIVSEHSW